MRNDSDDEQLRAACEVDGQAREALLDVRLVDARLVEPDARMVFVLVVVTC